MTNKKISENFFIIQNEVVDDEKLIPDSYEKLLFFVLSLYCNNGEGFPSYTTLAIVHMT